MRSIAFAACISTPGAHDEPIDITSRFSTASLLLVTVVIATFAASGPRVAAADTISIVGTSAFASESSAGTGPAYPLEQPRRFKTAQVGTGGNSPLAGQAGLLFFELPDLSAQPEITSAELTVELTDARDNGVDGQVPSSYNVDLYFLGTHSDLVILEGDYGDGAILPTGATLIQDNWWVASDDSQIGTSKAISVGGEINSVYTNGIPDGAYAVFGLYGDIDFTVNQFTTFFFEQEGPKPDLGITFVPEPSTLTLCAFGIVSLAIWRRRNATRLQ